MSDQSLTPTDQPARQEQNRASASAAFAEMLLAEAVARFREIMAVTSCRKAQDIARKAVHDLSSTP